MGSATWAPGGVSTTPAAMNDTYGTKRASMRTNVLLAKCELGKAKRTTFANPPPDHVFGLHVVKDAENAKEVTMQWQEHQPNPDTKPGPNFMGMNKLAAMNGLTSPKQLHSFRQEHPVTLKTGECVKKASPRLPSDKDATYTYGRPAGHRTAEDCRNYGPSEPRMMQLVQGAYGHEWVDMNTARAEEFDVRRNYIKPAPTKATLGHSSAAAAQLLRSQGELGGSWKMSRWEKVPAKVTQYTGKGSQPDVEVFHA